MVKNEEKNNSVGTDETELTVKQNGKARASAEQTDSARVLGDDPKNWFTLLDASFPAADLLESPAALAQRMAVLLAQRSNLNMRINTLVSALPDEGELTGKKDAYDKAAIAYNNALKEMMDTDAKLTTDTAKALLDVAGAYNPKQFANILEPLKTQLNDIDEKISDLQQQISMAKKMQPSVININNSK